MKIALMAICALIAGSTASPLKNDTSEYTPIVAFHGINAGVIVITYNMILVWQYKLRYFNDQWIYGQKGLH